MNPTDLGSNHFVISPNPHTNSPRNSTYLHIIVVICTTIIIKLIMDQFCALKNHSVNYDENWIIFDPRAHIKSPLEINVYNYKWLKNIGIRYEGVFCKSKSYYQILL